MLSTYSSPVLDENQLDSKNTKNRDVAITNHSKKFSGSQCQKEAILCEIALFPLLAIIKLFSIPFYFVTPLRIFCSCFMYSSLFLCHLPLLSVSAWDRHSVSLSSVLIYLTLLYPVTYFHMREGQRSVDTAHGWINLEC